MKLYPVHAGNFLLDGGAMFGVVPKVMWSRVYPADEDNRCTWAMRCLVAEHDGRLVLIDNGIGEKQDETFFSRFPRCGEHTLERSLQRHGFSPDDITDVVITHLHFDHCGGSVRWNRDRTAYEPAFKNARYWVSRKQWEWAIRPHAREKASFLSENIMPIQQSGLLRLVEKEGELFPGIRVKFTYGHTEAQMIPHISCCGTTVVFAADLFPSAAHVPVPWIMAYDIRPVETVREKESFLEKAAGRDWVLFLEHDSCNECCRVEKHNGGFRVKETFDLRDVTG